MDKAQLNFRSFTDTADGEGLGVISSAWNLDGTPTLYVIDHKGVIRYHAGMASYRAGKAERAREHLQAAVRSKDLFSGRQEAAATLKLL